MQDQVLLKYNARTYKDPGEKWEVAHLCLNLLNKLLSEYEPGPEDFKGGSASVGVAPGFFIMSHLHQTSLLLRTTLFLIDEVRTLLDTFTLFPGKEKLEGAVSTALTLLETGLRLSDSFISGARSAGASEVFTDLAKLLLGLNPRSGRPDHLFNVSRFILYGYWLPGARLSAVKIIRDVAASPANQASILATFTASELIQQSVLKAFTEALDADKVEDADMDSDEAEGKDHAGATRLAIMDLLLTGVMMSAPSVAHFLLGFDLRLGVGKSQLQPPSVCGVRSYLHALLALHPAPACNDLSAPLSGSLQAHSYIS